MARGVNKVILVGNLGADPDVRQTANGGTVTHISVATSEQWTDKTTGQKQERTEWHRVTLFARMGEVAAEFLHKGSQVYIEGSIRTDKYQDKTTGEDRYSTEVIARDMQLLGGRADGNNASQHGNAGGQPRQQPQQQQPQQNQQPQQQSYRQQPQQNQQPPQQNYQQQPQRQQAQTNFDDDIPF